MIAWKRFPLPSGSGTLSVRIAQGVVADIRRGRLTPGQKLPGTRAWAKALEVNRNTVVAAMEELEAQGWIETLAKRGTWVRQSLPIEPRPTAPRGLPDLLAPLPPSPAFLTPRPYVLSKGVLHLSAGTPDPRLFPVELLARTWRRVVRRRGQLLLSYGDPAGHPGLREALAQMVAELRAVPATAEHVVVTRGSQMALDLVASAVLVPGDTVAVEALGYRPAWDALRLRGARVVPIPVDAEGLQVEALARLAARTRVRSVYVTPHHQYPTTVTMSASRRLALLALAQRHRFLVIEDDYDHEFHYEGRPVLPLASSDSDGSVVYIATLSKLLAPGLRTGFVVAPKALIDHLAARRTYVDRQGDLTVEAALAELIEDGVVARHARRARKTYLERRDVFAQALAEHAGDALRFDVTRGGMALWARVEGAKVSEPLIARALAEGVFVQRTRSMCFDGRDRPFVRLGFAGNTPAILREAARRLGRAARRG